ncbi:IS30 family transposase, partial [Kitasatospora sp. NPDC059812]
MDFKIRKDRTAQGPRKLGREREEYFRLVQQGLSNREASRLVGVHERTGREWRNGRTDPKRYRAPPPLIRPAPARPAHPNK